MTYSHTVIVTGRLSQAERDRICELAERGLSAGQIAQRMSRHPGTINFAMHALGLKVVEDRSFRYVRNGKLVVSFSPEEDAWMQALRVQGYTTHQIAEMAQKRWGHPRTHATVGIRLKMLANRDDAA